MVDTDEIGLAKLVVDEYTRELTEQFRIKAAGASDAEIGAKSSMPAFHDFIWRPGAGGASIDPNDTLIGFKPASGDIGGLPSWLRGASSTGGGSASTVYVKNDYHISGEGKNVQELGQIMHSHQMRDFKATMERLAREG